MNICIDGLAVSCLPGTSLFSYSSELVGNLLAHYPQPNYYVVWNSSSPPSRWEKYRNIEFPNININRKNNNYSSLEQYLTEKKIHIYHSPNNGFSIPDSAVCHYVITVHDLLPITNPELGDKKYVDKFLQRVPDALKKAEKIIAVSGFIKDELISYLQVPKDKIEIITPGCPDFFSQKNRESCRSILKKKYGIDGSFILYSGSLQIRKNLPFLLKVLKEIRKSLPGLNLVIAGDTTGKRHGFFNKLKKIADDLGIAEAVYFPGTVDYSDMPCLYSCAECLLNLSGYEGFPFAILEAMHCRTPVLCSNIPAFSEIVGNGAVLIKDKDVNLIKDTVLEIINNPSLKEKITQQAKKQAKKFHWDASVKKLVQIYESIAYSM